MDYKKSIILNIIGATAFVAIFSGLIFFLRWDINKRATEYSVNKKEISSHTQLISFLAALKNDSEIAKNYYSQLDAYLVTKDQLINFSKDVGQMAQQNKIGSMVGFREEIPPTLNEPRKTNVSIGSDSESNFGNFSKFLEFLENSKYPIKFLSFDASQDGPGFKFNINAQIFSF